MAKSRLRTIGVWAFIIGVIIALLVGIGTGLMATSVKDNMGLIATIMVVLGLIVGLLNIKDEEITKFVIAAIGLATGSITLASLGPILGPVGPMVEAAFKVFGVFVAGAVFIPALKAVYRISKD
jgi:hypothetical protein